MEVPLVSMVEKTGPVWAIRVMALAMKLLTVLLELGVRVPTQAQVLLVNGMALTTVLMVAMETLPELDLDSVPPPITLLSETMASDTLVLKETINLLFLWVTTDMELMANGELLPTLVHGPEIGLEPTVPP